MAGKLTFTEMFNILVDGRTHSGYDDNKKCVTVGSAENADVCLPSAAAEHIKIYPMDKGFKGCFKVTVHARDGMTQYTKYFGEWHIKQWKPDLPNWLEVNCDTLNLLTNYGRKPPGWVLVHDDDSLVVGGREIKLINC